MDYFGENRPKGDFGRRSLRGGIISVGSRILNALVQVASVIVLARLLSPEDYGLVSMVGAILGIAPLLIDLGTRDAVIQQRHITALLLPCHCLCRPAAWDRHLEDCWGGRTADRRRAERGRRGAGHARDDPRANADGVKSADLNSRVLDCIRNYRIGNI